MSWIPIMVLALFCGVNGNSQNTKSPCDLSQINHWYQEMEWLNGLKIKPHRSIDRIELARQFCINPDWWREAFEFLATHDLETLETGRYVINEGNVTAYVSEGPTKLKEEVEWETHENFNDLQYVIRGKAGMGYASLNNSKFRSTSNYDPRKDVENYIVEDGTHFVAKPGTFFIFSPRDIHRPAYREKGNDTIKKILIKVRVP